MILSIEMLVLSRLAVGQPQQKKTECIVAVNVRDFGGRSVDGAVVRLIDRTGKVAWEDKTIGGGLACIADFPFGEYSVVVKPESCHPVEVHNITLNLAEPVVLFVTTQGCRHTSGGIFCHVYIRAVDDNGAPIPTAYLTFNSATSHAPLAFKAPITPVHADAFGRIKVGAEPGTSTQLTISAAGFSSVTIKVDCSAEPPKTIERTVVLARN